MSFLDTGGGTLEDVLGQQAQNQVNSIDQVYAKKRKQAIANAGANGRLTSGVQNYTMGDIGAQQAGDIGDVYSNLSSALAQVPTTDYGATQDNARQRQLAELIAKLNKPSALEEALSALSTAGQVAGTGAMLMA
jgi:hypothetical protein